MMKRGEIWVGNLNPPRGRLLKSCQVITAQRRHLDRDRIGEVPLATVTAEELAAVEKSLRGVMGLW
ncbi:hypothetical protein [Methylomonas koyamae]|uniref:hypothetical protein n=2 Tax=Methylomonas TaxID=416 RepID=UPI0028733717|nr:hypothetical protein [Methylomonas koyamae]WNB73933.1 hypothetical protein RI210_11595 [Methylomonas koyamae]